MSDTADTSQTAPLEDLDQRVHALVGQIERTTARIEQAVADDEGQPATQVAPAPAAPPSEAPEVEAEPESAGMPVEEGEASEVVEEAIEEAIEEVDEAPDEPGPLEPAAPAAAPQSLDALDADLGADLDRLLEAETAAMTPAEPASPEPVGADADLESELDALLKEGEISAPRVEEPEGQARSRLDRQLSKLREEDLEGGPEPTRVQEEPPAAPAPEAAAPAPPREPKRSLLVAAVVELTDLIRRGGPVVVARMEPAAYRAATAMSRPLQERAQAKRIVGWLALYTAILAVCVWAYALFLRPSPERKGTEGPRIVGVEPPRE